MADEPITEQVPTAVEQPAPAAATPAAPATPASPQQQLLDEYDLREDDLEASSSVPVAPEPAATVASPAPPAPPSHPRYLVEQALELGVSQADIDRAPTDRLAEVVFHTQRVLLNQARESQRAATIQAAKDQPPPGPAPMERGVGVPPPEEAVDLGVNEEDFAPELIGMLKRVVGGVRKEVADLKAQLAHYQQREFTREAESAADVADRVFAKYPKVFGTKGRKELAPTDPDYLKRMAVVHSVRADQTAGSVEQKLEHWASLFGAGGGTAAPGSPTPSEQARPPAPSRPARPQHANGQFMSDAEIAEIARWNGSALAVPTQRHGAKEVNGEAKARQSVREFLDTQQGDEAGGDDIDQFLE